MLKSILLVGIGGAVGSILRYLTSVLLNKYFQSNFPIATFTANVLGCLLIGILLGYFEKQHLANPELKLLLITGFCGGYTTFSTFSAENINIIQSGQIETVFIYTALSILISFTAVWIGLIITK